jgi:hypothetical protein
MRAMFLVVASVLLCVGLFGCDRQPQAPVAAPVVAAVASPCNCTPPAPAPVAQAVRRTRHHRHAWSRHESTSYDGYGESGESYSAANESREDSESSPESVAQSDAASGQAAAWVDGYGRSHYATGEQVDENPARLSREDRRMRRDVWRGYDSKCAWRDE